MATYDNNLRIKEIATGAEAGTWGSSTNLNLELIGEALGYSTQNCFATDADATTTVADGASDPARAMYFKVTSSATLTATRTLTFAPATMSRVMWIENATTGGQSITIAQGSGTTVTVANGIAKALYLDGGGSGANVGEVTGTDLESVTTDILPNTDNANDLGSSTKRWKDLYLSGGLYIGGTTSANFLDDYEEGTWTPTLGYEVDGTVTGRFGYYRKVGTLVHIFMYLSGSNQGVSATTGGALVQAGIYAGLPFTHIRSGSTGTDYVCAQGVYGNRSVYGPGQYLPYSFSVESTFVALYYSDGKTLVNGITGSASYISQT